MGGGGGEENRLRCELSRHCISHLYSENEFSCHRAPVTEVKSTEGKKHLRMETVEHNKMGAGLGRRSTVFCSVERRKEALPKSLGWLLENRKENQ